MKRKVLVFIVSLLILTSVVGLVMAATDTTTASVTVNEFLSVTIDDATLPFGDMDPLATTKPTGDPLVATIGAESNVDAAVLTKADGTDFCTDYPDCTGTGGEYKFAVSNLEWDSTDSFPGTDYSTTQGIVCGFVSPGSSCSIYHELTIPSAQEAGTYTVGITITAT